MNSYKTEIHRMRSNDFIRDLGHRVQDTQVKGHFICRGQSRPEGDRAVLVKTRLQRSADWRQTGRRVKYWRRRRAPSRLTGAFIWCRDPIGPTRPPSTPHPFPAHRINPTPPLPHLIRFPQPSMIDKGHKTWPYFLISRPSNVIRKAIRPPSLSPTWNIGVIRS